MIVQIVDARNPLLFYCNDLEKYVKEVDPNKVNLVLVNKSDFLTDRQRLEWLRYFERNGIKVAFWSAIMSHEANDLAKLSEMEKELTGEEKRSRTTTESSQLDEDDDEEGYHGRMKDIEENDEDDDDEGDEEEDEDDEDLTKGMNKFGLLGDEKGEEEGVDGEESNGEADETTDESTDSDETEPGVENKNCEKKLEMVKEESEKKSLDEISKCHQTQNIENNVISEISKIRI